MSRISNALKWHSACSTPSSGQICFDLPPFSDIKHYKKDPGTFTLYTAIFLYVSNSTKANSISKQNEILTFFQAEYEVCNSNYGGKYIEVKIKCHFWGHFM